MASSRIDLISSHGYTVNTPCTQLAEIPGVLTPSRRFANNMPHWCFVALLALVCHWLWRQLVRSVLGRGLTPGLSAAPGAFAKLSHGRVHYRRFLPLPQQQQQQQQEQQEQQK